MITIQSVMFVALGFLVASLLWLLAFPGFWARAVRLTSERLREAMPLTESEIRADKDRMRAEHALKIHHQQSELNDVKLAAARQLIELNRRDARINGLEADVETLQASLEGALNARNVLEQTVVDRLPRLEERLSEAKEHLSGRDEEIVSLTRAAERQARALEEARMINEQQKREMQRLSAAIETAGSKAVAAAAEGGTDAVIAMRVELQSLRTRSREQSALIDRLQKSLASQKSLAEKADAALAAAGLNGSGKSPITRAEESEKKLREARAEAASREQELERLRSTVAVHEKANTGSDSRLALKANLGALEEKTEKQESTIKTLRAELAALQEQLTHQTAEHAETVARLGGGTLPLSAVPGASGAPSARERRAIPRLTLAERVAQSRQDAESEENEPKATATPATRSSSPEPVEAVAGDDPAESGPDRRPSRIKSRLLDRISNLSKA